MSDYNNKQFDLSFNITLADGIVHTPRMRVFNNKEASITIASDEALSDKNIVQLRVKTTAAKQKNRDVAVLVFQLLQMVESTWSILSEGELVAYLDQSVSMSLQGTSGVVTVEVMPSAVVHSDNE